MPCGCQKKSAAAPPLIKEQLLSPAEWGPILWKYLHCIAERIGYSGSTIIDTDQASYMEILIHMLPLILPCTECQTHTNLYLQQTPLPILKGLYGNTLGTTVRQWLFDFHNAVRQQNNQPILIHSIEECSTSYVGCTVPKCEYSQFIQSVAAAVRQGWVKIDQWRRWYSYSERMRILSGNVIT